MSGKTIKGITIEFAGETVKLGKALKEIEAYGKDIEKQLKQVDSALKLDPDSTELLTQKQRVLGDQIENTSQRLEALKAAQEAAAKSLGNYDAYIAVFEPLQKEIDSTKKKITELTAQQKKMERAGEIDTEAYVNLSAEIDSLKDNLKNLTDESKRVKEEFGNPISTQEWDKLQLEIAATEAKLQNAQKEVQNVSDKLNAIDSNPLKEIASSLEETEQKCRGLETELDAVNQALNMDPGNIQLLTQKQDILTDSVEETRKKLELLEQQQESISRQYASGDVDRGAYLEFQNEIVKTKKKLDDLESSAKSNMNNIADAVDGTKSKLKQLGDTAENVKKKADNISDAFQPFSMAAAGLATAAAATVPATEELREDLSKLDANAKEHAVGVDAAREAWKAFAIQSGETDSAVEAVSNLLQADFTESNLQKAVEGLAGAALRFPDTLKIESLADSLQETLASGEATGQFSELLSRLGMDVEAFNNNLAACTSEAEKQNLVLQTLADAGLNDTYQAWKNNNAEMLANKDANLELQQSMADLAQDVLPVMTQVTNAISDFIKWFANLPGPVQGAIGTVALFLGAISPVAGAVSNVSNLVEILSKNDLPGLSSVLGGLSSVTLPSFQSVFSSVFNFIAQNPVVALIGAIAIFGDDIQNILQDIDDFLQGKFATDWTQIFGPVLGGALNKFCTLAKKLWDGFKLLLDGVIDFVRGVFTGDWERAWRGVSSILEGIFSGLENIVRVPINGIIGMVNGIIDACNLAIDALNKLPGVEIDQIQKIGYWESSSDRTGSVKGLELTQEEIDRIIERDPEYMVALLDSNTAGSQSTVSNRYATSNTFNGDIVINAAEGQNVEEMGDLLMEAVQRHYESEEAGLHG